MVLTFPAAAVRLHGFPGAPVVPPPAPVVIPETIQAPVAPACITARRRPVSPRGRGRGRGPGRR